MKKTVLIAVGFGIVFVAAVVYSTLGLSEHRVEVCVVYNGQRECRTASGATRQEAQRTATDNACALIASGMTQSMACTSRTPVSIKWLDE